MALFFISVIIIIIFAAIVHLLFSKRITFQESLVQCGVTTVLGMFIIMGMYYRDMTDYAVINGQVTSKARVEVSCSHSYRCNCYTTCSGTGSQRTCTEHCSTCYEHGYDVDWRVKTTVGNLEIDRVNRQGTKMPPRWDAVVIGEPASRTSSYINYVKAAPDSLFRADGDAQNLELKTLVPKDYPKVFDYYRYNRIMLTGGATYPDVAKLNDNLNNALREMGARKQVNIQVLFVGTTDPNFRYVLERAWLGGKKNDVIVLVGMDKQSVPQWFDVVTFGRNSGNEMLAVVLKDDLRALKDRHQFGNPDMLSEVLLKDIDAHFTRKQMKDFEYLKEDYKLSNKAVMWYIIIQVLLLTGTTIFFYHFELERGDWYRANARGLNRFGFPLNVVKRSNHY